MAALALAALALPAWAQDKPAEDEKLYGTWELVTLQVMGKTNTVQDGPRVLTLSKGGKMTFKRKGEEMVEGTFKLTGTPGQIDVIAPREAGQKAEINQGIYQVDGDTLKVALVRVPGNDRPASFEKAFEIATFKRQKP